LKNTFINIARTSLEAYDIQLDYTVQTRRFGDVNWYALATWQPHYENQRFATDPIVDKVGFADGLLEWRGNLGFDWTLGAWSLGWNMQYYDSYFVYNSTSSNPTMDLAVLNQGSDTIPRQMYHDLIATYRFDHAAGFAGGLLANSELSLGIQNAFNTSPPIIASQLTTDAGYSFYGDPRLRRYSMVFRKSFGSR
jgi:outer membrane receptor protein involved in Fe transport